MSWWIWVVLGLALLALEVVTPTGFFLFILGLSALVVVVLAWFGLFEAAWVQFCIFALVTIVEAMFLRKHLAKLIKFHSPGTGSDIAGSEVTALSDIPAGGEGRGELRGAGWNVRNIGQGMFRAGTHIRVESVDGLTLVVRA